MAAPRHTTLLAARVAAVAAERVTLTGAAAEATSTGRVLTARDLRRVAVTARTRPAARGRPAIAANASLALMIKIGEHLVGDDTSGFLSFPAVALAADPPGSFGLIHTVSLVPRHAVIWHPPIGATTVWDVWGQIVAEAIAVDPEPDAAEQAQIDAARRFIFSDPAAGTMSAAYERYQALLDDYLDVAAAAAAVLSGGSPGAAEAVPVEPTTGPPVPDPPTAVEVAARRLAVEGRQAEVEAALAIIARFGMSRPTVEWHEAGQALKMDTNWALDAPSGTKYPHTTFVPSSFEQAAWTTIDLDAADIESLSALAAARFPALAESHLFDDASADEGGQLGITGLRAEITRLAVRQPLFRPDLLSRRSWRFRDPGAEMVSDGGTPATGRLPAFVTSVAVIRNLEISRIRFLVGDHRRPAGTAPAAMPGGVAVSRLPSPTRPARGLVRDHRSTATPMRRRDDPDWFPDPPLDPEAVEPVPVPPVPKPVPVDPVPVEPAPVPPHLEPAPRITAFVCQLVPRSPDPDPALPNPFMEATS